MHNNATITPSTFSTYRTMVKLLIGYMFKRRSKQGDSKKQLRFALLFLGLGVLYLSLAAFLVFMVYMMSPLFVALGLQNEFITLILMAGLLFVLIFGIVAMLSNLYFSRDNEFFMALPLKSGVVFAAKLSVIFLTELITSAAFLLPTLITFGVAVAMPAFYYIVIVFAVLLTPAIPLFLASLLAIPIMYLVSFFKNKGAIGSIAAILVFILGFVGYYFMILQFTKFTGETAIEITENMQRMFVNISYAFYPLYALAKVATGQTVFGLPLLLSVLVNVGIFIATVVVLGGAALFISNKVYRKGASAMMESSPKKKAAAAYAASGGIVRTLIKKEWREMIRTPAFAFQCLGCLVLAPIVLGFMQIVGGGGSDIEGAAMPLGLTVFITLGMINFFSIGTNVGASTSITREGDKFYYMKLIPVPIKTQIRAKAILYVGISFASALLTLTVTSFFQFDALNFVLSLVFLLLYGYGFVHFAIWFDLLKPKLDWVTPNEATKNSRSATIPMFLNMGVSVLMIVAAVFIPSLLGMGAVPYVWSGLILLAAAIAVGCHILLYKNCERLLKRID